jgi:predicted  nucleic acid-binding Zn-ribbon protein
MSLRALEIAYAVFGESLRDEFRKQAGELDRAKTEVHELLRTLVDRDKEIAALRLLVKQLTLDKNGEP